MNKPRDSDARRNTSPGRAADDYAELARDVGAHGRNIPADLHLPACKIRVDHFEVTLLLPVFVQARKQRRGDHDVCCDPRLDPKNLDFLDKWAEYLVREESPWRHIRTEYPRSAEHHFEPSRDAEPSYSEFCYFHPFVRNFLYLTRGDIREHYRRHGKQAFCRDGTDQVDLDRLIRESPNRNLRILVRDDLEAFIVQVAGRTSRLAIQSCWLYLFDTQIAVLELQLRHTTTTVSGQSKKLSLRDVMWLQDSVRRVYAPYWSVFEDSRNPGTTVHRDEHVPAEIRLVKKTPFGTEEKVSSFGNYQTRQATPGEVRGTPAETRLDVDPSHTTAVKDHLEHVRYHREPFTVAVWRELLHPLSPNTLELEEQGSPDLRFEHIQDDRATLMSYIAVANEPSRAGPRRDKHHDADAAVPDDKARDQKTGDDKVNNDKTIPSVRRITTGDWLRLAVVDDPGKSEKYPYSPTFFDDPENPLAEFAYDRFWHRSGEAPGQQGELTRWLCSGYGFSAVGDADDAFFADEHAGALCHFRRHYFALGLIAQFHRASLLLYKHRLAEAADKMLASDSGRLAVGRIGRWLTWHRRGIPAEGADRLRRIDFRGDAERLAEEIMRFRTLYWFSEVSNQVQGMELFALYRKHLNLQALFDDVMEDVDAAVSLLRQWDGEEQTRSGQQLAVLGSLLVILGPLLGNLNGSLSVVSACLGLVAVVLLFQRWPTMLLEYHERMPWYKRWLKRGARWLSRQGWLRGVAVAVFAVSCVSVLLFGLSKPAKPPVIEAIEALGKAIDDLQTRGDTRATEAELKSALQTHVEQPAKEVVEALESAVDELRAALPSAAEVPESPPPPDVDDETGRSRVPPAGQPPGEPQPPDPHSSSRRPAPDPAGATHTLL